MGPSGRFTHGFLYWIVGTGYIQVIYRLYIGYVLRVELPVQKETLPDFHEKCRVTQHSRVFPRVDG